ncbi:Transcription factor IIIA [Candida viswanathii]|uniref:Transcription factor IIIA n=1 Tax=Candida viswanathii TaxID=5486 RepID=A0A367XMV5_9ASCO|nr:Transcription factor IIIA [Candida viswanathii]
MSQEEEQEDDTRSISSVTSTTSSTRPKKYVCTFENCNKAYNRPSLLDQHLRSHTNDRPYKCTIGDCDKSFLRKSHLETHIVSHSDDKPYHCSTCGKGVNTKQHLKRHEITHTKSFKCSYVNCNEAFYKHQSLRHHVLTTHETSSLMCSACSKTFTRPSKLEQHNLKHHGAAPAYQCDTPGCFKNFKTWSALQFHVKQDHPRVKCSVCGKGCVGKKGLMSHMLTHDESKVIKLWNCNYCDGGRFSKKAELIAHYNEFHDGNVPEELLKEDDLKKLESMLLAKLALSSMSQLEKRGEVQEVEREEEEREDDDRRSDVRSDSVLVQRSIRSLTNSLSDGKDIVKLISQEASKPIACPKGNCHRTFARDYDLQRHLKWHDQNLQKIELFLSSLEKEQTPDGEPPLKRVKLEETVETS